MEKHKSYTAFMNLKNVIPEIEKVLSGSKNHYWSKRKGMMDEYCSLLFIPS